MFFSRLSGLLLFALCACYRPLYAIPEAARTLPRIEVMPIPGWYGEALRQNLSFEFPATGETACLRLKVDLVLQAPETALNNDKEHVIPEPALFSEGHNDYETILATADVQLINVLTGLPIASYRLEAMTPFAYQGSIYRSQVAQDAGLSRVVADIGYKIRARLRADLASRPESGACPSTAPHVVS